MNDRKIFKKLGRKSYIRNGIGYGFISDDYLYDNGLIEIGIGRVSSGYGDWGGGFSSTSDSPLKISIDKNLIIRKVETSSFYNNKDSQKIEKKAISISKKLKIGSIFKLKDKEFKKHIEQILTVIPCKHHIGHDVFESPHMIKYFTEDGIDQYNLKDSKYLINNKI